MRLSKLIKRLLISNKPVVLFPVLQSCQGRLTSVAELQISNKMEQVRKATKQELFQIIGFLDAKLPTTLTVSIAVPRLDVLTSFELFKREGRTVQT